jgi:hypothetical protein
LGAAKLWENTCGDKKKNDSCENYVTEPYYALEVAVVTTTRLFIFILDNFLVIEK